MEAFVLYEDLFKFIKHRTTSYFSITFSEYRVVKGLT